MKYFFVVCIASSWVVMGCGGGKSMPGDAGMTADGAARVDGALDGRVGGDAAPDAMATHDDMLAALGVDTHGAPMPMGPDGNALPAHYNPLGRHFTAFEPKAEIFVGGPTIMGARETLYDDSFATGSYPVIPYAAPSSAWLMSDRHAAFAADVNGDGDDEIVVAYWLATGELDVFAIDRTDSGAFVTSDPVTVATGLMNPVDVGWFQQSVAAAQLDDDPAEELVIGYRNVYFLDDLAHHFAQLGATQPYDTPRLSLDAGDLDGSPADSTDEIVVVAEQDGLAYVDIFDGTHPIEHRDSIFAVNEPGRGTHSFYHGVVKLGNFDGRDPQDEIAIVGNRREYDDSWNLVMMDDATTGFAWFRSFVFWVSNDYEGGDGYSHDVNMQALDLDGDHIDEIFVDCWVVDQLEMITPSSSTAAVTDGNFTHGATFYSVRRPFNFFASTNLGRVQPAGVGNVASLGAPTGRTGAEEIVGIDADSQKLLVGGISAGAFHWSDLADVSGTSLNDVVAVGNIDRDSPIVRFDDEHELLYSDPQVVAALAAAPFYSDMMQATGNCYTAFGRSTAMGVSATESMGVSVGWSIGYEADILFGAAKIAWSVNFEEHFDRVAATSHQVDQAITFATGLEDSVVFTATPFDVYYYTVVSSAAGHPEDLGRRLTVNIPRAPQTLLTTQGFYDAHNGDGPDTGQLFHHHVGMPHTYSTPSMRDMECAHSTSGCYRSRLATVGEGSGFTEVDITVTDTTSVQTSFDFSVDVSASVSAGGVMVGHSMGFHYGYALQETTTMNTYFTGRVGNLTTLTPTNGYSFGLYAWTPPFAGATNQTVMMDYWVQ